MNTDIKLPRCYDFSFDSESMTLFLHIQKWIVPSIITFLSGPSLLMDYVHKDNGGDTNLFAGFGHKGQAFGFDQAMTWHSEDEHEIVYAYALSPVLVETGNICPTCQGSKISFLDHECDDCRGTGVEHVQSSRHFASMMHSLYPVVEHMNFQLLERYVDRKRIPLNIAQGQHQAMAVAWSDTSGMCNCSMNAWFDKTLSEFTENLPADTVAIVREAMRKTEAHLLVRKEDGYNFRLAQYGPGNFMLSVPGNACTLGTESGTGMFGGIGVTLHPHNIDNRFQQVEFLTGLATINDLYRKSLSQ